jgi:hypothetical protein
MSRESTPASIGKSEAAAGSVEGAGALAIHGESVAKVNSMDK